jgi:4a-hydroxytetrahydrobiopterin dehydratase
MKFKEMNGKLELNIRFDTFLAVLDFIQEAGHIMESQKHHADITIHYTKVKLTLCTHDAGNTITNKDRILATEIETMLESYSTAEAG